MKSAKTIMAIGILAALSSAQVFAQQVVSGTTGQMKPGATARKDGGSNTGGSGAGSEFTLHRDGGSNTGGSGTGSEFVLEWCRGNVALLNKYRQQATLALLENDTIGARALLSAGLQKALERKGMQGLDQSLTYKAILRGLQLATALEGETTVAADSQVAAMLSYYDFVSLIAAKVDIDLYIPYHYTYLPGCPSGNCEGFDIAGFERRFIDYAREQLKWFESTFVAQTDSIGVTPRHSAKAYLKVLEFISKFVADDLEDSLWRSKYACTIDTMQLMSEALAAHNAGNMAFYRNDKYAVNLTNAEVTQTIAEIGKGCGGANNSGK